MEEDLEILEKELVNIRNLIDYYTFESLDYDNKFRMERFKKAIENLIARNKELEEDNYAYHQLMQMQNKREYRSKFLKDFKAEYGENVMPDYDEIYKRYDKMKKQLEDSIPKSKAREKIKKYESKLKQPGVQNINTAAYSYYLGKKEGWEELLQEGDK